MDQPPAGSPDDPSPGLSSGVSPEKSLKKSPKKSPEESEATHEPEQRAGDPASTPFDHPLSLPAILAALAIWFFYDGFINQDEAMLENLTFNRGGFAVLSLATAWFGYKGWREMHETKRRDSNDRPSPPA